MLSGEFGANARIAFEDLIEGSKRFYSVTEMFLPLAQLFLESIPPSEKDRFLKFAGFVPTPSGAKDSGCTEQEVNFFAELINLLNESGKLTPENAAAVGPILGQLYSEIPADQRSLVDQRTGLSLGYNN